LKKCRRNGKQKLGRFLWQKCRRDRSKSFKDSGRNVEEMGNKKKLEGFTQKCTRRDGKQKLQRFWQECSRDGNPKKELPGFWQTCRRIRDRNKSFLKKDSARIVQEMEILKNKSLKGSGRNVEEMEKTKAA